MEIIDLIQKGESSTLEFKSTLRLDVKTGRQEKFIEHSVLKTLAAFLNSDGGTLLIGIDDNKNILGLDKDFNSFSKGDKKDEFQKHFDNIFGTNIGNRFQRYLKVEFPEVDGKTICSVTIKEKSEEEVYITNDAGLETFYIRRQASTIALKASETVKYIKEHWKATNSSSINAEVTELLNMFSSKEIFQKEMNRLLADKGSIYQQEIKEHWNSYSIFDDSPFLNEIAINQLNRSIGYGLLPIVSDFVRKHLQYEKDPKYIYNQPHIHLHNRKEEGYEMPVYYHIRFIGLLYSTAIHSKVDIDIVSHNYKNMQSIFSSMIEGMIDNLINTEEDNEKEYPTNYHWLISEIFSITGNWLDTFNEAANFVETSSYVDFIPFNIRLCLSELYKGVNKKKISTEFLVRQFYYRILTNYFSPLLNNFLRDSIEEKIIANIPKQLIEPILKFSLDENYAIRFDEFCNNKFHVLNQAERSILNRFRNYLIANRKI